MKKKFGRISEEIHGISGKFYENTSEEFLREYGMDYCIEDFLFKSLNDFRE